MVPDPIYGIALGLYSLSGKTSYCKIYREASKSRDSGLDFSSRSEI